MIKTNSAHKHKNLKTPPCEFLILKFQDFTCIHYLTELSKGHIKIVICPPKDNRINFSMWITISTFRGDQGWYGHRQHRHLSFYNRMSFHTDVPSINVEALNWFQRRYDYSLILPKEILTVLRSTEKFGHHRLCKLKLITRCKIKIITTISLIRLAANIKK